MVGHPVLLLAKKIELHYSSQIEKFWKATSRKRAHKFYLLLTTAKNGEQLKKDLLFKKLMGKSYSEKNDPLWRNEVRVLKTELEKFIVDTEHQIRLRGDENYRDWLVVQGFERLKYPQGVAEHSERMHQNKIFAGDFQFVLDSDFTHALSYLSTEADIRKLMETFPALVQKWEITLAESIGQNLGKMNVLLAQYNMLNAHHHKGNKLKELEPVYNKQLPDTNISQYYDHYAKSFTGEFEDRMMHFTQALRFIEPIAARNPVFAQRRIVLQISLGRELSSHGHFEKAHEVLAGIKDDIDENFIEFKTVFYVNYVTNLVKCRRYKEALQILDGKLIASNVLYQNMLLQNRLLCYLNLRDVKSLSGYISYNLDEAPFPQNYMLKLIKSAYFYLVGEYEVAEQLVTNLLHTKDAHDGMHFYSSIGNLYRKFYTTAIKNTGRKHWGRADTQQLTKEIKKIENDSLPEMKLVSVYLWMKQEIEDLHAKSSLK